MTGKAPRHETPQNAIARRHQIDNRLWAIHCALNGASPPDPLTALLLVQERIDLGHERQALVVEWSEPQLPGVCEVCGGALPPAAATGRPRTTCSDACRARSYRKLRARAARATRA